MRSVKSEIYWGPVTPVLLAVSFVLSLYFHNIGELTVGILPIPVFTVSVIALFLYLLSRVLIKSAVSATVYSAILTVLFFTYGDLRRSVINLIPFQLNRPDDILLFIWIIIGLVAYLKLRKTRISGARISGYLLIFSLFAFLIPLTRIIFYELNDRTKAPVKSPLVLPISNFNDSQKRNFPDIYYIVPDSYSNPFVFGNFFGYDNSTFAANLTERKFYVPEQFYSNYPKTYLSLTSTLNMEYLDYLSVNTASRDELIISPLLKDNNVLRFLTSSGYSYYQLGSWWGPTQYNRLAKRNINLDLVNPLGLNGFNYLLAESTVLKPLLSGLRFRNIITESPEDKRKRTLYQFEQLSQIVTLPGPKFIFAHILAPHGPNVFGPECEFISQDDLAGISDELGYTNQVRCINKLLLQIVDRIIENSVKPPVILIQSDEGAAFLAGKLDPVDNWKDAGSDLLRKKFPVLAAFYLPGIEKPEDKISKSSVNSFRTILNAYFNAGFKLLPDRNMINLDMDHRYDFREVTEELDQSIN